MQALQETTKWASDKTPNHVYLVDGTKLLAYIRKGTMEPVWFNKPMKNFDRRYRTFRELKGTTNPFAQASEVESTLIKVIGSKGAVYYVDPEKQSCTCPGFQFRSACKHLSK
jgi:hypothetical protein